MFDLFLFPDEVLQYIRMTVLVHFEICNLFVTSKNKTTNSPIHEFKVLQKDQRAFQNPSLMVYYFLFITSKTFKALHFCFKGIKRHFAAL